MSRNNNELVILNSLKVDQLFRKWKRGSARTVCARTDAHGVLLSRCCFLCLRFLQWNWMYRCCHLMQCINISNKRTKCRWRKPCVYFPLVGGEKWTNVARLFAVEIFFINVDTHVVIFKAVKTVKLLLLLTLRLYAIFSGKKNMSYADSWLHDCQ
jgi:hypothetical protein